MEAPWPSMKVLRGYSQKPECSGKLGRPISQANAVTAAIARAHGADIAARDLAGFRDCGIKLIDPWKAEENRGTRSLSLAVRNFFNRAGMAAQGFLLGRGGTHRLLSAVEPTIDVGVAEDGLDVSAGLAERDGFDELGRFLEIAPA